MDLRPLGGGEKPNSTRAKGSKKPMALGPWGSLLLSIFGLRIIQKILHKGVLAMTLGKLWPYGPGTPYY